MKANNNFHILIVDDEKFNIELVAVYLKEEGYKISFALSAQSALDGISSRNIDLILLDVNMPQMDGFELCRILKKDPKTKDIPVIFLTAQTSIEYISKGFEVGGVDYITKPFNAVELKARVNTHLQNIKYLQEIQHKQAKFAQLSITDPLTKLHNSLYFDSQIKMFQKNGEDFWIFYITLDKFDKINSLYGFYKANKILRLFAKLLKENTLSSGVVARLHGVHFAILVKGYEIHTIENIYKKITKALYNNEELHNVLQYHMVMYHVKDTTTSLASIYKKLQQEITTLEATQHTYKFIH